MEGTVNDGMSLFDNPNELEVNFGEGLEEFQETPPVEPGAPVEPGTPPVDPNDNINPNEDESPEDVVGKKGPEGDGTDVSSPNPSM